MQHVHLSFKRLYTCHGFFHMFLVRQFYLRELQALNKRRKHMSFTTIAGRTSCAYKVDGGTEKKYGDHGWHNIGVPLRVYRFRLTFAAFAVRSPLGCRAQNQLPCSKETCNGNHMAENLNGWPLLVGCRLVRWSAAQLTPSWRGYLVELAVAGFGSFVRLKMKVKGCMHLGNNTAGGHSCALCCRKTNLRMSGWKDNWKIWSSVSAEFGCQA
jgi:hypothetical protein